MIQMLTAIGATGLVFFACLGLGAAVLAAFRLAPGVGRLEAATWSFAVGLGLFGWVLFFPGIAGWFDATAFFVICIICAAGVPALRRFGAAPPQHTALGSEPDWAAGPLTWLLWGVILVALAFDALEATAPPADADSLAYHFALPKQFLADGRIEFVPRAATGAAPLLLHMTYAAALGLGGELGLTLWTAVSGWMAAALAYVLARRSLSRDWALAVCVLFLTTPAVLYGAGTGQVETRLCLFALAGAYAAAEAVRQNHVAMAALAGAMAGFYAGAKFMGLLFAAAAGMAMLTGRGGLRRGLVFGIAVLLTGSQWYVWNWIHTGDPFFPVLHAVLDIPDSAIWNRAHDTLNRSIYFAAENPLPRNPMIFLAYPVLASLGIPEAIEAGRTGFGPAGLLVLPFVLFGLWRFRRHIVASPLFIPVLIAFLFYALWFASGTSQRARHLLPIYPIILIAGVAIAARWAREVRAGHVLAGAAAIAIAVQFAGVGVFSVNPLRRVLNGEQREDYLRRNIGMYPAVAWANAHLGDGDRLLTEQNEIIYLLKVPVYHAHPLAQALVDISPRARDPQRFLQQTAALGISHILVPAGVARESGRIMLPVGETGGLRPIMRELQRRRCTTLLKTFEVRRIRSRSLDSLGLGNKAGDRAGIFALDRQRC